MASYVANTFRFAAGYARKAFGVFHQWCRYTVYCCRGLVQDTVTIRTRQGLKLTLPTRDAVIGTSTYFAREYYERDYALRALRFLKKRGLLPPSGGVLLDVGANIGMVSLDLLAADEMERAIAVEPEPRNFGLLRRNVEQNGMADRILCLAAAAGEKPSEVTLARSPTNAGDHRVRPDRAAAVAERFDESRWSAVTVPCLPLPDLLRLPEVCAAGLAAPSLVWIDVQGYEGHVFRGAADYLRGGPPVVAEVWPYGLLRAGTAAAEFCRLAAGIWSDYWVDRRGRFCRYPVAVLDRLLDELGEDSTGENVIFTA
jgi:FkbM family methyltransferase